MAMGICKECKESVSSKAKICPHCGIKKPYQKEQRSWKEVPLWQKIFVFITVGPLVFIVVAMSLSQEQRLHKKVVALDDSEYQKKYEGYLALYKKDDSNQMYRDGAIEFSRRYLKALPVTEPERNLAVYRELVKLDSQNDYSNKIERYEFMVNTGAGCAAEAQMRSRDSLRNKSTYDNSLLGSYGGWKDSDTYGYVHVFEAANSFGIVSKFTATYLCNVDFNAKKYALSRVALNQE